MSSIDLSPFLALRRHLKIAHHIPGRIRLRVGAAVLKEAGRVDAAVLKRILDAVQGIEDVRVNAAAGSAVITYAPKVIEPDWWETLVRGEDQAAIALLRRLLNAELAPAVAAAREG
jgi:hypothetical protein